MSAEKKCIIKDGEVILWKTVDGDKDIFVN